jgi:ubiquinone/menaquinone biosynthesis C-methylase UbiE
MALTSDIDTNDKIFARDKAFWNNYLKGRPQVPETFFERIFRYHKEKNAGFGKAHDAGAGNGPYSQTLRNQFDHVVVSDIVPENVEYAKERLGNDGYSFRVAKVEDGNDILDGSVDLLFATNVMHFVNQEEGMKTIIKQLKSGATLAIAGFGPACFYDPVVQDIWRRISQQGGRVLLKKAENPAETIKVMERSQDGYNLAPLDNEFFLPGAKRVRLNMSYGGITGLLPEELRSQSAEPDYTGINDEIIYENEEGWSFRAGLEDIKQHFATFPHSSADPSAFVELWRELEQHLEGGKEVEGVFPAVIILATRR